MLLIARLEMFSDQNFITCIEVSHMTRNSSKSIKLRNVNTVRGTTGNVPIKKKKKKKKKENLLVQNKVIALIINFG